MEYVTMKNEEKAIEIAKENAYEWRDQEYGDVSSEEDCYESAMAMADFKDAQPISKLGCWHTEPPTEDGCYLAETFRIPYKNCHYIVAEYDTNAQA
jgi:hypothetical protein